MARLLAAGLISAVLPLTSVGAASDASRGYLPFASGASIYVSQGNCLTGVTPTHCDQFGNYAWDMVYARGGRPIDSYGLPVVAAVAGKVVYAYDAGRGDALPSDCKNSGSGNFVIVDDGDGTYTQYLHLADGSVAVNPGQELLLGNPIGSIGSSGESTGAHLHFSWVTAIDHCGVGVSTPGSFVDQPTPVPLTGDVLSSDNPGPLPGRLITDGTSTYVVAGGAPILLPDCGAIYGAPACSRALDLSGLDGLAVHPLSGTDLLAQPSGLAYRVVGGTALPITDCANFSSCANDTIAVPDSAITGPDARLTTVPAEWSVVKTPSGNAVWQFAIGCLRSSTIWFDPTYATLVPANVIGMWPGCPLPEPDVAITHGSPSGSDIFFSLWDRDGDTYGVSSGSASKGPQAAVVVSFTGVPKSPSSITANLATRASRSCAQTAALWNWKSGAWNKVGGASVSSTVVRTGLRGKAAPSDYVGGPAGTVRLRLQCTRAKGGFGYSVDWTQVLFVP